MMGYQFLGIALTILVTALFLLIPIRLGENKRWRAIRKERRRENKRAACRVYDQQGYDKNGKNDQGKYNRFYDVKAFQSDRHNADGFLDPRKYLVGLTDHGRQRMTERLGIQYYDEMYNLVFEAYQFGKSVRQVPASAAAQMEEKQKKYGNGIPLLYRNHLYVFSPDNVLITVCKNDDIVL